MFSHWASRYIHYVLRLIKKSLPRSQILKENAIEGALLLCPCLSFPSDNVWFSRRAATPRCAHFSTVISPSLITEQISVGKCMHRGASACRERQTSFKIVTWTKQTWTKHHNTGMAYFYNFFDVLLLCYKTSNFNRAILPYAAG